MEPSSDVRPGGPSSWSIIPLVQHKLALLRRSRTPTNEFRGIVREMSLLLAYEATRAPAAGTRRDRDAARTHDGVHARRARSSCLVSILRAGNGILDGMLDLLPSARVGHIGLYRDPVALVPVEYYLKLPEDVAERQAIVVDPMLATGHSAVAAVDRLRDAGVSDIRFICLLAAPEGIATFHGAHPDVPIYTAAIDRGLDAHGYIRPGLGDAGDRLYGTR